MLRDDLLGELDRAVIDAADAETAAEDAYRDAGWDEHRRRVTFATWRESIDTRRAAVRARREEQR